MKKSNILIIVIIVLLILISVGLGYLFMGNDIYLDYSIIETNDASTRINVNAQCSNFLSQIKYICIDNNPIVNDDTKWVEYHKEDSYALTKGDYYIHVKDSIGNIQSLGENENTVLGINIDTSNIKPIYPIGESIELSYNTFSIGKTNINVVSSNQDVASIENDIIQTKSKGKATIYVSAGTMEKSFEINVTDLYTFPDPNSNNKPFLKELVCSTEEAHMLDQILEDKINQAGYNTRAGVVAAARFLSLEFPYKLTYFSESGRLDTSLGTSYTDGEGRYYHKGLFLSEDKFEELGPGKFGRACWGQFFEEDDSDDHSKDDYYLYDGFVPSDIGSHLYLSKRPNGLDCSGFVSWCYYNGGFDFGDMGAGGPDTYGMSMLGERVNITDELLQSDRIKAGDLVGLSAHVGIVIGVEDDYIWIADTLITGLKVKKYERNVESFEQLGEDSFQYFMLMDNEYKEDGNYTAMWN